MKPMGFHSIQRPPRPVLWTLSHRLVAQDAKLKAEEDSAKAAAELKKLRTLATIGGSRTPGGKDGNIMSG